MSFKRIISIIVSVFICSIGFGQIATQSSGDYYEKAMEAINNDNFEEAYGFLIEQNKQTPNNALVLVNLAYCELVVTNNATGALSTVNKAFDNVINNDENVLAQCYATRAYIYENLNDINTAIYNYTEAIKLDSSYTYAIMMRGRAYLLNAEYDKALKDFETLENIDPINGLIWKTRYYGYLSNWDEALEEINNALKISSNDTNYLVYELRGSIYLNKGMYSEAIDDLISSLEFGSTNTSNLYGIAANLPEWNDYIISKLRIMSNKNPDSVDWLIYLGDVYRVSSELKKALKCYQEAVGKGLGVDLNERIANCLSILGFYSKAYKYIELAIDTHHNNVRMGLERAEILYQMGRPLDAISAMDRVVQLAPENYYAYHQRGWYKELYGNFEGALEDYNIAIVLNPNHAFTYFNRGRIKEEQGIIEAAKKDFEMVLAIDTVAIESEVRHFTLFHLGETDKAKEFMSKMLKSKKSMSNYYDAACLYSLLNERDAAIIYLRKALELGFRRFYHISIDKDLDNIRNTEVFKSLIKEYETIFQKELKEYETFI